MANIGHPQCHSVNTLPAQTTHVPCVCPTLATLSATRYLAPIFSSSAITQSVMQGMHSAYRHSIMPRTKSI